MFEKIFSLNKLSKHIVSLIFKLLIFILVTFLFLTNFKPYVYIDKGVYDRLYHKLYSEAKYSDVVVINISDRSFEYFNNNTIPREAYGKLLNKDLKNARAVSFDILFPNESNEKSDNVFAKAIENHGSVTLGYMEATEINDFVLPCNVLLQASNYLGYVNYEMDNDGFVRQYLLSKDTEYGVAPSLVYSTLTAAGYRIEKDAEASQINVFVNSTGRHVSTINVDENNKIYRLPLSAQDEHYSIYDFADVYDGKVPSSVFDDKIVFIGGSYTGSADFVVTPIEQILGVKFIVDSLIGILEGFNPVPINHIVVIIITAFAYILVDLFTSLVPGKYKWTIPILGSVFIFTFAVLMAALSYTMMSVAYPILAITVAFIINLIFGFLNKEKQAEMHKLPVNAILQLNNIKTSDNYTFSSYIRILEENILKDAGLVVENVEIFEGHKLYDKYLASLENTNEVITVGNYVFIPLSNRSGTLHKDDKDDNVLKYDNRTAYCALKSKSGIDYESVLHISALVISADIYFKFANESNSKQRLFNSIIESMVAAIDAKDPITSGHSKRVAEISVQIGKLLNLSEYELERLRFAAIIHDIGKIGIADGVLNKPSFFSDDDFKEIQKHPEKGIQIMQGITLDEFLKAGILYHHERLDGKGYPNGLKGDEIPQVARIIKIADVYDALISDRQYKKAWPLDRVCNLLYQGKGTEFDADLVDIFLEDIKPEGWTPPEGTFNNKKVFRDDTRKVALRFLDIYVDNIKGRKCDEPMEIDFSFDLSKDFAGLSFGNHFTDKNWLYNNPICAKVFKEEEEMYYFKDDFKTGNRFTYIFLRGYLSSGIVSSTKDNKNKELYLKELHEKLGEPFHKEDDIEVWDNFRFYIINFIGKKDEHITIYINKYVL